MKKGFTLIELLAVIVILAIIAVIAVPIVLNIMNDIKEESIKISAKNYLKAVDYSIFNSAINKNTITDGIYNIQKNGNICLEYTNNECIKELNMELQGETPDMGSIVINNGQIYSLWIRIKGEYFGKYLNGELELATYTRGTPVYYNVTTGESCSENDVISSTGTKSGCMRFYVIKDLGSAVDLILDHNTTANVAWATSTTITIEQGPINVITALYNDTKDWVGTEPLLDYFVNRRKYDSKAYYNIEYSKSPENELEPFKARLINSQEVAFITGAYEDNFFIDESSPNSAYHFDGEKLTGNKNKWKIVTPSQYVSNPNDKSKYAWLFNNTKTCLTYGCDYEDNSTSGYWVSSAPANAVESAWAITFYGHIQTSKISNEKTIGVRPVITLLKSKLGK